MRHGERAPVDTYPNDPYINSSMAPYGWGQLTNVSTPITNLPIEFVDKKKQHFIEMTF